MIDRRIFFAQIRQAPFAGSLSKRQVEGTQIVLDTIEQRLADGNDGARAYILATAFHETASTMQPVRETLAASDDAAIAILDRAFNAGRLPQVKTPYWRRDGDGKSWLGRGLVQLTHKRNYVALSGLTGIDLAADPTLALDPQVSAVILVEGMRQGAFTGRRLGDYFGPSKTDFVGARAIINGRDRAQTIAGHARAFSSALKVASR